MRDNALYFPYIRVPQNSWFTHTLLYWNKVSSIVPTEYLGSPDRLGKYMQDLLSSELLTQIHPGAYIYQIKKFEDNFLKYVDSQLKLKRKLPVQEVSNNSPLVHTEKLQRIGKELEKRNLAIPTSDYAWYRLVDWVADAFMSYLATSLGQLEDVNSAPVTQDRKSILLLGGKTLQPPQKPKIIHNRTRDNILDKLLPIPDEELKISDLVNFKSSHGDLLKAFRNKIEEECIDIANTKNKLLRNQKFELSIHRLENDIKEIEEVMKSRWNNITFQSFFPLFAAGASLNAYNFGNIFSWSGAALGLGGAVYSALKAEKSYQNKARAPLAYAAFVRKTIIQRKKDG